MLLVEARKITTIIVRPDAMVGGHDRNRLGRSTALHSIASGLRRIMIGIIIDVEDLLDVTHNLGEEEVPDIIVRLGVEILIWVEERGRIIFVAVDKGETSSLHHVEAAAGEGEIFINMGEPGEEEEGIIWQEGEEGGRK